MPDFEALSSAIAGVVETASGSVVRVQARARQAASGVVWDAAGTVVTADHVIEQEEGITVGLPDGTSSAATLAGRDPIHDIAVLRLATPSAKSATLTAQARPKVGTIVIAVARPGDDGVEADLSMISAVSGPSRTRRGGVLGGALRTGVTMYPGFSGSALVNATGEVVGILSSHLGSDAGTAIPTHVINGIVANILQHGRVRRAFLGFRSQPVPLNSDSIQKLDTNQSRGLLVLSLEDDCPAARGGLIIGDIVVSFADQAVQSADDLQALLTGDRIGVATPIKVLRGNEPQTLSVLPAERT